MTSFDFTLGNFQKIFSAAEFWDVLKVSVYYTVFGTAGALLFGLFAAQIMQKAFFGRPVIRGLMLFPYVAPVIAVAFPGSCCSIRSPGRSMPCCSRWMWRQGRSISSGSE